MSDIINPEREAVYIMRRTDETAWHVTTFQTFEHIASGKSPQHEAVKLYAAAPAQPAAQGRGSDKSSEVQRLREALHRIRDHAARVMDDEVFYEADSALTGNT